MDARSTQTLVELSVFLLFLTLFILLDHISKYATKLKKKEKKSKTIINRPGVAGAVLQTALSLINSVNNSVSHGL